MILKGGTKAVSAKLQSLRQPKLAHAAGFLVYAIPNIWLSIQTVAYNARWGGFVDWFTWEQVASRLDPAHLYGIEPGYAFVWSPVAAHLLAAIVVPLGIWPWAALHALAVGLLRSPWLVAMTLLSWGFWVDVSFGNAFTFIFVAAVLAIRGSRVAGLFYLIFLILMPRPVQLPLAVWILWTMPSVRWPFAALLGAHTGYVVIAGYAVPWVSILADLGSLTPGALNWNVGPTRIVGNIWLVMGVPLAAWLTFKGRPGWGGLAMTPYLLPQYLLLALLPVAKKNTVGNPRAESKGRSSHSVAVVRQVTLPSPSEPKAGLNSRNEDTNGP